MSHSTGPATLAILVVTALVISLATWSAVLIIDLSSDRDRSVVECADRGGIAVVTHDGSMACISREALR